MNNLDDSSREAYRLSLLNEVTYERFGPVPWREESAQPLPLPRRIIRFKDKARTTARRRRDLNAALLDPIDAPWVSAA